MNARDGLPIAVLGGEFVGMSRNIGECTFWVSNLVADKLPHKLQSYAIFAGFGA